MPTDSNGFKRAPNGMFAPGNKGGPGNPNYAGSRRFRRMLIEAVSDDDFNEVIRKLIDEAKDGKPWAVLELLNRVCGKADQKITVESHEDIREKLLGFLDGLGAAQN